MNRRNFLTAAITSLAALAFIPVLPETILGGMTSTPRKFVGQHFIIDKPWALTEDTHFENCTLEFTGGGWMLYAPEPVEIVISDSTIIDARLLVITPDFDGNYILDSRK